MSFLKPVVLPGFIQTCSQASCTDDGLHQFWIVSSEDGMGKPADEELQGNHSWSEDLQNGVEDQKYCSASLMVFMVLPACGAGQRPSPPACTGSSAPPSPSWWWWIWGRSVWIGTCHCRGARLQRGTWSGCGLRYNACLELLKHALQRHIKRRVKQSRVSRRLLSSSNSPTEKVLLPGAKLPYP